jgi:hypothetical protein
MIKLGIIVKKGRLFTDYSDKDICLNDVALLVYELEKIKGEMMKKKFKLDLRIDEEKDEK